MLARSCEAAVQTTMQCVVLVAVVVVVVVVVGGGGGGGGGAAAYTCLACTINVQACTTGIVVDCVTDCMCPPPCTRLQVAPAAAGSRLGHRCSSSRFTICGICTAHCHHTLGQHSVRPCCCIAQ